MDRARRRRFGQNFLDDETAKLIAGDLPGNGLETILEIGPGHGAMTDFLLEKSSQLTAVEIDYECVRFLRKKFAKEPKFKVIAEDFLKFDLEAWLGENPGAWLTGNLPYNVSTAIMERIVPQLGLASGFMGMVQLEVAERICAVPGTHAYGSLSVFVSSFAEAKILRKIGPEHFTPRPNVESATMLVLPRETPLKAPEGFFEFVREAFTQKRKRLANSLSSKCEKSSVIEALETIGLSENARAEELSPEQFLKLFHALAHSIFGA